MLIFCPKPKIKASASDHTGYMVKKNPKSKNWKMMYFALNVSKRQLLYFEHDAVRSCFRNCHVKHCVGAQVPVLFMFL
jgi:hypothetical protein